MTVFSKIFRQTGAPWTWMTPQELQAQLAQAAQPRLVDVRGPEEFRGPDGHIAGAENLPMPTLLANLAPLVGETQPVVLICLSQIRSGKVADALVAAGGKQVSVVRGGMQAWRAASFPVQS